MKPFNKGLFTSLYKDTCIEPAAFQYLDVKVNTTRGCIFKMKHDSQALAKLQPYEISYMEAMLPRDAVKYIIGSSVGESENETRI